MTTDTENQKSLEVNINPGQNMLRPDVVGEAEDALPEGVVHISEAPSFSGPQVPDPNYGREMHVGLPVEEETAPAVAGGIPRDARVDSKKYKGGVTASERTRLSDAAVAINSINPDTMGSGDQARVWGNAIKIGARAVVDAFKAERPDEGWRTHANVPEQPKSKEPRVKDRVVPGRSNQPVSKVDFTKLPPTVVRDGYDSINPAKTWEK